MVELELQYLFEIERIAHPARDVVSHVARKMGLPIARPPEAFSDIVDVAKNLVWTRDPFDRLITAQAAVRQAPLVTGDKTILSHYDEAIW